MHVDNLQQTKLVCIAAVRLTRKYVLKSENTATKQAKRNSGTTNFGDGDESLKVETESSHKAASQ